MIFFFFRLLMPINNLNNIIKPVARRHQVQLGLGQLLLGTGRLRLGPVQVPLGTNHLAVLVQYDAPQLMLPCFLLNVGEEPGLDAEAEAYSLDTQTRL